MNVARLVASVAGYLHSVGDAQVAVHLYGGAQTRLQVAGGAVPLTETSDCPWFGDIFLQTAPDKPRVFTLAARPGDPVAPASDASRAHVSVRTAGPSGRTV